MSVAYRRASASDVCLHGPICIAWPETFWRAPFCRALAHPTDMEPFFTLDIDGEYFQRYPLVIMGEQVGMADVPAFQKTLENQPWCIPPPMDFVRLSVAVWKAGEDTTKYCHRLPGNRNGRERQGEGPCSQSEWATHKLDQLQ